MTTISLNQQRTKLQGEGSGHIEVQFASVLPGMRVGVKASELFKSVELDRGRAMSDPVSA